jgi:hypothetical protein
VAAGVAFGLDALGRLGPDRWLAHQAGDGLVSLLVTLSQADHLLFGAGEDRLGVVGTRQVAVADQPLVQGVESVPVGALQLAGFLFAGLGREGGRAVVGFACSTAARA